MSKAYYNENDPFAAQWLRNLIDAGLIMAGEVDDRSIHDVQADDIRGFTRCHFFAGIGGWDYALQLAAWPDDRPVWTGSCPCQPFSSAGKGLGQDDPRHLWPEFYRLIQTFRPATIFGEQVVDDGWHDLVGLDLEREDYGFWSQVRRASCVGADHDRPRLYWLAADASCERQQEPGQYQQDARNHQTEAFGQADRFVDAVRREALPFLCRGHDGIPARLGEGACRGLGNAIVPQVAAEFIQAYMECAND